MPLWKPENLRRDNAIELLSGIEDEECLDQLRAKQQLLGGVRCLRVDLQSVSSQLLGGLVNSTSDGRYIVGVRPIRWQGFNEPLEMHPDDESQNRGSVNIHCRQGDEIGFCLFHYEMRDDDTVISSEPFVELCTDGSAIMRIAGIRTTQLGTTLRVAGSPLLIHDANGTRKEVVNAFAMGKQTKFVGSRQLYPPKNYYNGQSEVTLERREPLIAGESLQDGDELDVRFIQATYHDIAGEETLDARSELRRVMEDPLIIPEFGIRTPLDVNRARRPPQAKLVSAIHARFVMDE